MTDAISFPVVQLTLWLLAAFSVATWALIAVKAFQSAQIARASARYVKTFGGAANLQTASEVDSTDSPVGRLAKTGFDLLRTASAEDTENDALWDRHDVLERSLKQHIEREKRVFESGLAVLASVGSTAPFVGLFGTVWGIMTAMKDISRIGNASIDVVAGPIGEALIATGIGIAVAIPAVLGYNFFVRRLKTLGADLQDFGHDFLNLAQRAGYRVERGVRPVSVNTTHQRDDRAAVRHGEFA